MSADDSDDETPEDDPLAPSDDPIEEFEEAGDTLGEGADRAVETFDEGVIDLLSWILDTETRARIYVYLRQEPDATSKEVAEGTGLYPSTVREALAELHDEGTVTRQKRQSDGAGNNPYEYAAISPSDLVGNVVGRIQSELNAVFDLDDRVDSGSEFDGSDPVTITVEDGSDDGDDEE
jgi:predicted transcriptional regulator